MSETIKNKVNDHLSRATTAFQLMEKAPDTFFTPEMAMEHFKEEAKKAENRLLTCVDLKARRELIGKRDFCISVSKYIQVACLFQVEKDRTPPKAEEKEESGGKIIRM
jgi:hypothetical protein